MDGHLEDDGLQEILLQAFAPRPKPTRRPSAAAKGIARLAGLLAGSRRESLRDEWEAHLAGQTGAGLPRIEAITAALGFVAAAIHVRLQDLADLAWCPVDAVISSRELSNLAVAVPTLATAVVSIHGQGLYGIVSNADNIIAGAGAAYGLIRVGRWWRQVQPPKRKKREDG